MQILYVNTRVSVLRSLGAGAHVSVLNTLPIQFSDVRGAFNSRSVEAIYLEETHAEA